MDYEYSRPFFQQAIEGSLIKIEDANIEDGVKATALFLLNLSHASLGGENIFSSMIGKMKNKIPVHIQLAINHETDAMQTLGGDIKKFKRAMKRGLLNEKRANSTNSLYDKELRYLPNPKNENHQSHSSKL